MHVNIVVIVYWYHCCVPLCAGIAPVVTTAKEAIQHSGSEIAQATFTRSGEKVCIICSSSVYLSVCTITLSPVLRLSLQDFKSRGNKNPAERAGD